MTVNELRTWHTMPSYPRWSRRTRVLLIVTMLVVLLAQTLSLICAPRHFELAPSSFAGAVDVMQAGLPHEVDGTDACCTSDIASGDALSTPIASPPPSGSYMLPLAGVFLLVAAAVAAPWTGPPLASRPPRLRRYYARSSRILG